MKDEDEWRYQIGELMLRFADIESYIAQLLNSLPPGLKYEELKNKDFKDRCNAVIAAAQKSKIRPDTIKTIVSSINEAMKLAETRNLIAHNPICMSLESIFDNNTRYEIRSYRKNHKYIELPELKEDVTKLQSCANNLYHALSSAESEIYA